MNKKILHSCIVLSLFSFHSYADISANTNHDTPQLIVFTLDDALHSENEKRVDKIDNVPWTFYINVVSQAGGWDYDPSLIDINCITPEGEGINNPACLTNPDIVRKKYTQGHEMALHTYTHPALAGGARPLTEQEIRLEIQKNYDYLISAGVAKEDITGFRAPFLDTQSSGWDRQIKNDSLKYLQTIFNELNITNDSSWTSTPEEAMPRQGVRHCASVPNGYDAVKCDLSQEADFYWSEEEGGYPEYQEANYPHSWHLFMSTKTSDGTATGNALNVMDTVFGACAGTCTTEDAKSIWLKNFIRHYDGERTPYGIFLHGQSLDIENEVQGLKLFIQEIKEHYPDAYFVTASQAIKYQSLENLSEDTDSK